MSSLFENAQSVASNNLLCYVNADIILMSDFMRAVREVRSRKRRFLVVGRRWNVKVQDPLDFNGGWEARLRDHVQRTGWLYDGMDYFVFPRNLFGSIPPFAFGRGFWDNWLMYRARRRMAALIDATKSIMAVHQDHDYGKFGRTIRVSNSEEWNLNLKLLAKDSLLGRFTIDDATHLLLPSGVKVSNSPGRLIISTLKFVAMCPLSPVPSPVLDYLLRLSLPPLGAMPVRPAQGRHRV